MDAMDFETLPITVKAGLGFAAVYALYLVVSNVVLWNKRKAFRKEKGTLEAAWVVPETRIPLDFLGIGLLIDNMKAIKNRDSLEKGHGRFEKAGANTFQVKVAGLHLHTTRELENLKVIATDLKTWQLDKRRKVGFTPLLGTGIFTADGKEWQHSREMLRPNFVRSQVGDLSSFEKHVSNLISLIPNNETINLSDLFFRLSMDFGTEFLFGESTNSLTKSGSENFADAFEYAQNYTAQTMRAGPLAKFFTRNPRFEKDRKFVNDFVDHFVQRGLARSGQSKEEKASGARYVFIDELVRRTSDRVRIRSELLNILLAGRDTTGSLLTNVWHILSTRPDIWTKLQEEVASLQGEHPSFDQIQSCKYLRAILNESLRLHPVVPLNSREASVDTTLPFGGGEDGRSPIMIKKGEIVSWNVYSMHRRKDYFGEDVAEFKPERWMDEPETGKRGIRPGWEYLPFFGGPRICLGQQFALTEASYTTIRLCQEFASVESREERPWTENTTLTCVNHFGAKLALTRR